MKEVTFRGKNKNTGQWAYGDLIHKSGKDYIGYWIKDDDSPGGDGYIECEVVSETIGQFIGEYDINANRVFKGDIVKVKSIKYTNCSRKKIDRVERYTGEVVWHQYGWYIAEKIKEYIQGKTREGIKIHSLWLWNIKDDEKQADKDFMEVIGNRWETPELRQIPELE